MTTEELLILIKKIGYIQQELSDLGDTLEIEDAIGDLSNAAYTLEKIINQQKPKP